MSQIIFLDGQYLPREQALVSVYDHGILYGDGIFEGIRCYDGNIFRLREHLVRLWDSAKVIGLSIPMTMEEMEAAHVETMRRNGIRDAYIRTVVTRGVGDLGIDPRKCSRPTTYIIAGRIALFPPEDYELGIPIITAATRRVPMDAFNPRVKSLNYLNNVLAKMEATNAGVRDAMMLNAQGFIVECTAANVFLVRDGVLSTPPISVGALAGITRGAVIGLARAAGIEVREQLLAQYDAYVADEMFVTGTGAEVMPVTRVDGRVIGSGVAGPVTKRLTAKFRELVLVDGTRI